MRRVKFHTGIISDTGQQRPHNEDAYALPVTRRAKSTPARGHHYLLAKDVADKGALFLVADGVGGSEAGQVASLASVCAVVNAYYASKIVRRDLALERAVVQVNEDLYAEASASGVTGSTTLVGLLLLPDRAFALNVGDSRAYRLRQGRIERLTQDHSLREEWLHDHASVSGDDAPAGDTSEGDFSEVGVFEDDILEQSVPVPGHIITRSIGRAPDVMPDIFEVAIEPDDQFLLCTDGLTRHVNEEELLALGMQARDPQKAAESLASLANARGGKDNITVLLIRLKQKLRLPANLIYTVLRLVALSILLAGVLWAAWRTFGSPPVGAPSEIPQVSLTLETLVGGEDAHE